MISRIGFLIWMLVLVFGLGMSSTQAGLLDEGEVRQNVVSAWVEELKPKLEVEYGSDGWLRLIATDVQGYETVNYVIEYQRDRGVWEMVVGSQLIGESQDRVEWEVMLGTCSDGDCVKHEIDGGVLIKGVFVGVGMEEEVVEIVIE